MRISILRKQTARPAKSGGAAAKAALPVLAALLAMTFASCVKTELIDGTYPPLGSVVVTPDWSVREPGTQPPASYVVRLGDDSFPSKGASAVLPGPFASGKADLWVYNTPRGMTVENMTAKIEPASDGIMVEGPGGLVKTIEPMPEPLYTFTRELTLVPDETLYVPAPMQLRTRLLNIELTITEGDPAYIRELNGLLTGVADTYDFVSATFGAEPATTAPRFSLQGDKITASARLLGVYAEDVGQALVIMPKYTDGKEDSFSNDVTDMLAGFNSDMATPLLLKGNFHAPTELNPWAEITDWEIVAVKEVVAD